MNILIFNQYFWPENFRINEMACALKAKGHAVEVMTGKPNYPEGQFFRGYDAYGITSEIWKGIPIYRMPILARGSKSALKLSLNYLSFIVSGLLFAPWILKGKQYDVIFVYAPSPLFQVIPASFLGWLKGIPVVLWVQDLWPQSAEATGYIKSRFLLKIIQKLVRFAYSHTDLILVQSKAFVDPVAKLSSGIPIVYYPNSVAPEFYTPNNTTKFHLESLKTGFSIMFAGNIGAAQSMETVIAAAEILRPYSDIKIVIVGSGSKSEWLSQQVSERELNNIYLEGRYPVEAMPCFMKQASALLVTLSDQPIFELTIPSKIQAYLAVGKPVIACLNGEGARIIDEARAGITVAAEDGKGLAEAILKLNQLSELERKQMSENGRIYFKLHFEEGMLINDLISHFKKLINKKDSH